MTITAKIIADSINSDGNRMTTMEIEYPRFILAELNTHRMLSKNSASSRAIPVESMHKHIHTNPAAPIYWGKNQPGMQAKEELSGDDLNQAKSIWNLAKEDALHWAKKLFTTGAHKQVANRITEPWMTMKTVISGTEWANFFWLRNHEDAQPEIAALAIAMFDAMITSIPNILEWGEWHVPYVKTERNALGILCYYDNEGRRITVEQARIISASCCAQVSYRKNDDSYDKAVKIYKQLIESVPAHASPVEHQATPMSASMIEYWRTAEGITHLDKQGQLWSGNLQGWIQFRKTIPNEAKW